MMYRLALLAFVSVCSSNSWGEPFRFRFEKDQKWVYQVDQATTIIETVPDEKVSNPVPTVSKHTLSLKKQWHIQDVDPQGNATLELRLLSMRLEMKRGDEAATIFDSKTNDVENQAEFSKMVNVPIAVLKIDTYGKLIEVVQSKFGPASKFKADLPFKIAFPTTDLTTWEREFNIQLDPPQGTGEQYQLVHTCESKIDGPQLVVMLKSRIKNSPESSVEEIPLLSHLNQGEVFFDKSNGKFLGAKLEAKKTLKDHQGDGSSYSYYSTYRETFIPDAR